MQGVCYYYGSFKYHVLSTLGLWFKVYDPRGLSEIWDMILILIQAPTVNTCLLEPCSDGRSPWRPQKIKVCQTLMRATVNISGKPIGHRSQKGLSPRHGLYLEPHVHSQYIALPSIHDIDGSSCGESPLPGIVSVPMLRPS